MTCWVTSPASRAEAGSYGVAIISQNGGPAVNDPAGHLRADCARCAGLCCVAPAFSASADFAMDKPAGQACPHLGPRFRCSIHDQLRQRGFPGCTVYDCFGAGQRVTQVTFGGRDWRQQPQLARPMFAAFTVMRQLHELLWYLRAALLLPGVGESRAELGAAVDEVWLHTELDADGLAALDLAALWQRAGALLRRVSRLVRATAGGPGADHRGADLVGRDLRRVDLRAADLGGAHLIGADLRGVDLTLADLTGADLRAADLRAANLARSIFVIQSQLDAAGGDASTALPRSLTRPAHWSATSRAPRPRTGRRRAR